MPHPYDLIVGLEVHVQLQTKTKLFCRCSTKFGGTPPNTQTCPICIGMPGSLPVMNREAFRLGMKTAIALNCEIPEFTKWDRKQYYYPDLPKGYQISQYDLPMSQNGWLEISDPKKEFAAKRIGIIRAHLEEDAGKSLHDEEHGKADTRIDLNRTGTPLLEIVSAPDMRSTKEARVYLTQLRLMLLYLGVSDCNMQEGSLRVDANVNIHIQGPNGKVATPIVEVKNLNSFRHVERALAYEAKRQYDVWEETGRTIKDYPKQTRGWDDAAGTTLPQREKEESADYRYFPDPDLVPVITPKADVEQVRSGLVELPAAIRSRLEKTYGISDYDSDVIVLQGLPFVEYFEKLARVSGDGKQASNWMQQTVLAHMNEKGISLKQYPFSPEGLAEFIRVNQEEKVDLSRLKQISVDLVMNIEIRQSGSFELVRNGKVIQAGSIGKDEVAAEIAASGIAPVNQSDLEAICAELVAANPKIVADVKAGKQQAVGALLGQAKKRNPNANPNEVRRICLELIEKMG